VGIRNCPKYPIGIRVFLKVHKNLKQKKKEKPKYWHLKYVTMVLKQFGKGQMTTCKTVSSFVKPSDSLRFLKYWNQCFL
jgi:hypothetical protein